jgi:pimeloyl-ACP methyl ester carboxylesterase
MGRTRRTWASSCVVGLTVALAACAGPPVERSADASPSETAASDFAMSFDVGDGRTMFMECRGSGSPTVVIITGQRAAAGDWMIVADGVSSLPAFSLIAERTRVCAYDRPGTVAGEELSRSDPVPQPANSQGMVDDLRALLAAADISGPVVLAAHSAGGLAARLFASEYPDEVAGMVLVDTLSEALEDSLTAEQWAIQKPLLRGNIDESIKEYPALEWLDAETSFDQVRASSKLRQMPLIVVSADQAIGPTIPGLKQAGVIGPEIPDDFGYVTDIAQAKSQAHQAALVSGSIHITKTDSGHDVHIEQPALVADAVLDVVERVRANADTATD